MANYKHTENMTVDEKLAAISNLRNNLEENFIALGQLLSEIKRSKIYRMKGYESFKDFVEQEFSFSSTLANKLVGIHDLYIEEMDIDGESVKEIGYDKLQMVKPIVQKADWDARDDWMHMAQEMPTKELRDHIKTLRKQDNEEKKDLKKVYIDQFLEKMTTWFNCSKTDLNFKLALYFQDADLEHIRKVVKERQRQFESELQTAKEETT